jgi:hypothetical protein
MLVQLLLPADTLQAAAAPIGAVVCEHEAVQGSEAMSANLFSCEGTT